jgi:SH3-like domain-containing protein
MIVPEPVLLLRLLLCGMLVGVPGAMGQTTSGKSQTAPKNKPTPVLQAHGPTHPLKPPPTPPDVIPPPTPPAPPPPAPAPVPATPQQGEGDASKGSNTGLPLPRFAALRSDEVNLRAGPGTRYPIEWIYKRRELPVEILREFEVWRLVQDPEGIKGWVHQATLTGRRSFVVTGAEATLRHEPQDGAMAVAILKPGVIGRVRSCGTASSWCQVQVGEYRGYLKRSQFWGTLPGESLSN